MRFPLHFFENGKIVVLIWGKNDHVVFIYLWIEILIKMLFEVYLGKIITAK